jgi:predicted PolB exonuclease-like 3'-5' exonuclease
VDALGAPHVGDRSEKPLIASFCEKIAELRPHLVSFNGHGFDLRVLRYPRLIKQKSCQRCADGSNDALGTPCKRVTLSEATDSRSKSDNRGFARREKCFL